MNRKCRILLIDDDQPGRLALELLLKKSGFSTISAADGAEGINLLGSGGVDLVLLDLFLPDRSGIEILQEIREIAPTVDVVMITGHASAETAVQAMKEGAFDYITKPVNFEELKIIIAKVAEKQLLLSENIYLRKQLQNRFQFENIIGRSRPMMNLFERMQRIIKTDSTVLITGESGTGKELVAKALHHNGRRRGRPLVIINCGAIPETLLESELFGHVKGSFTGAIRDRVGKFEAANHGTIFLDEIGTLPLQLQTRLLRVLQEQELERVGSTRTIKLDVRVISATNSNLEEEVRAGNFREDLFYRLNVIPLQLPSLRERKEDILPLVSHFLEKFCRLMGRPVMGIGKGAVELLEQYQWPGNVRELENVVERLVALTEHDCIEPQDLPSEITELLENKKGVTVRLPPGGIDMPAMIAELEQNLIQQALQNASGVKARAAELLGLNRTTLVEKIRRLGISQSAT